MTSKYYKLLIVWITISLTGCTLNLENPKLPKSFSCESIKCCYESGTEPSVGLCGYGGGSGMGINIKGRI